jgi:hypothetical protein
MANYLIPAMAQGLTPPQQSCADRNNAQGEIDYWRTKAERLEAALRKYGTHKCLVGLSMVAGSEHLSCTCGLSAALGEGGK